MSPYVRYIDKTRAYYEAEGYGKPYEWAHLDDIPFSPFAAIGKAGKSRWMGRRGDWWRPI